MRKSFYKERSRNCSAWALRGVRRAAAKDVAQFTNHPPCILLVVLFVASSFIRCALGDSRHDGAGLVVGPLPDLQQGAQSGVFVSSKYIERYSALLPPELSDYVRKGAFTFEAVRRPRLDFAPPDTLIEGRNPVELDGNNSVPATLSDLVQFPFPPGADLDDERNSQRLGAKILWNTITQFWRWQYSSIPLTVQTHIIRSGIVRQTSLLVERLFPRSFGLSPGRIAPLFREKIRFVSPGILSGFQWLTLRFLGTDEDYMWAASPATNSVRQLTGSNRSDPLYSSGISAEDLFVWSGKIELAKFVKVEKRDMLVPLYDNKWGAFEPGQAGCLTAKGPSTPLQSNGVARRFAGAPSWLPANIVFALRSVWILNFESVDLFALESSQTVYVDEESMLPVYKAVVDQSGIVGKFSIGIIGLIKQDSGNAPFSMGQILLHSDLDTVTLINADSVTICDHLGAGRTLDDFDPAGMKIGLNKRKDEKSNRAASSNRSGSSVSEDQISQEELASDER